MNNIIEEGTLSSNIIPVLLNAGVIYVDEDGVLYDNDNRISNYYQHLYIKDEVNNSIVAGTPFELLAYNVNNDGVSYLKIPYNYLGRGKGINLG